MFYDVVKEIVWGDFEILIENRIPGLRNTKQE